MAGTNTILRSFLPALYPVAALLSIAPLMEMFGVGGQARPGLASWRFGVMGLGFNALIVQTLGLAMALAVAAWMGHRRVLRAVSTVTLVAAVVLVAGIARFVLDFAQVQDLVPAAERAVFDAATLRALIVAALAVPVLVVLGGKGWMASGIAAREPEAEVASSPRVIPFPGRARAPDPRWR